MIGPKEGIPAQQIAHEYGVEYNAVAPPAKGAEAAYAEALVQALHEFDWLCLAGYLQLVPSTVLAAFPGRILNIHPALLPKFGGKGMYGHHVHKAVIEAGETESGCTVHLVNERYDEGDIVLQKRCPVLPDDTAETLGARVLALEHTAYAEALNMVIRARGTIL